MKKFSVVFLIVFFTGFTPHSFISLNETKVYICNGKLSKKYHFKKNCRGLDKCSTEVEEVTLESAKDLGRGLWGWED